MQFSDTTNKLGLIQDCERKCNLGDTGISGDALLLKEFTAYINEGNRKVWSSIFFTYSGWIYDDSNQTDLPSATDNLVDGTGEYTLPTDALTVRRVEIKDSEGNWVKLKPFALEQVGEALEEWYETDGQPVYYRLVGRTIELKPSPNYASTDGLKVYFDRTSVDFASTDTTQTPGFAEPFHELLSVYASLQWQKAKQSDSQLIALLRDDWDKGKLELKQFYTRVFPDKKKVLTKSYQTYK